MEQVFDITVNHIPGLLARVESIFRRQRTPIRSFFFEAGEGCAAQLTITAEANSEAASLLRKQLMRLVDVREIVDSGQVRAFAQSESSFNFEERRA